MTDDELWRRAARVLGVRLDVVRGVLRYRLIEISGRARLDDRARSPLRFTE